MRRAFCKTIMARVDVNNNNKKKTKPSPLQPSSQQRPRHYIIETSPPNDVTPPRRLSVLLISRAHLRRRWQASAQIATRVLAGAAPVAYSVAIVAAIPRVL